MWELPKIREPICVDINQSLVAAVPLAYYAKTQKLLHYPFQHADRVLLRLIDLPVDEECKVTVEVTFKVSHFKNMLRASAAAIEMEQQKDRKTEERREGFTESFMHLMRAS